MKIIRSFDCKCIFFSRFSDVHVSYTREKFEDFGGYADPKDVKRPEKYNYFFLFKKSKMLMFASTPLIIDIRV